MFRLCQHFFDNQGKLYRCLVIACGGEVDNGYGDDDDDGDDINNKKDKNDESFVRDG